MVLVFSIFLTLYSAEGGCRHIEYLTPHQIQVAMMYSWLSLVFCIAGLALGKVSVAILIGRLMAPCPWQRYALWLLAGSACVIATANMIIIFVQCTPAKAIWDPTAGKCWDLKKPIDFDIASSGMSSDSSLRYFAHIVASLERVCRSRSCALSDHFH